MFSKVFGGIEQSFLDYNQALAIQGFDVHAIIHPKARIKSLIHTNYHTVSNVGKYDLFAAYKLRKLIEKENPGCIIAHAGRAVGLLKKTQTKIPLIAVSHNANFTSLFGTDAIVAVNSQMKAAIINAGQKEDTVYCIPNMIHMPPTTVFNFKKSNTPPTLGVIARFEEKKGIEVFLSALAILRKQDKLFRAVIAGDGDSRDQIINRIHGLGLKDNVELMGWVQDREEFYKRIDIFCLPSLIEPFGIVVLEAFIRSIPAVVTDTEGPLDIVTPKGEALMVAKGDAAAMANALGRLLEDEALARTLAESAFMRAQDYSVLNVSRLLKRTIEEVCFKRFGI